MTKVAMAMATAGLMASGYAYAGPGALNCNSPQAGPIPSNVVVDLGNICVMTNVQVSGNISVRGGTLIFQGTNTVAGNVSIRDHEPEDTPGALLLGVEGSGEPGDAASLEIGTPTKAANLHVHESYFGTSWQVPRDPRDVVIVNGNAKIDDSSGINNLIAKLMVHQVPNKRGIPKKGNLDCEENLSPSVEAVEVDGNESGDGSCHLP